MYLFWCISMTNNVESCKKINGRVQTFRFSVFTMGRQELCAENTPKTPKLEKLKRKLLNFLTRCDLYGGTMLKLTSRAFRKCCSFWDLEVLVIGFQSPLKFPILLAPKIGVQKKRHGHNFQFWAPPLNQRGPHMVGSTLIQWQRSNLIIVAVSFFLNTA